MRLHVGLPSVRIIRVSVSRGLQKKSYGHKTYYFTDRKAGLTIYESPSVYGVHPFVRLTFLPSVQSVRPSVRSVNQHKLRLKKTCVGEKLMR